MLTRIMRWFDVRPGEGRAVLYVSLYIAIAVASFLLAKPIRNGLFLREFGPYKLVYAYIGVPLVLALLMPLYQAGARRVGQRLVITGSLVFLAANVLLFWWGFRRYDAAWLAAAFYVWVNCYGVIAPVQAWSFANAVFDTRQARRLFGVVGSGASLGAIAGGLLARLLVGPLGTVNLLLVLAALILSAALLVNLAWGQRQRQVRVAAHQPAAVGGTLALVLRTRYLRSIVVLVMLVAIVTQWTSFQFSIVVAERFGEDADGITRFLGMFNLVMGLVSFATQLVVTGPLLRRFGLSLTLLILPAAIGVGSLLTVVWPGLWAVLLTNTFDQGLRFSVDKASFELLYLPVNPEIRARVKAAIDLVFNRVADGVGGVLLGLATQGFAVGGFEVPGAGAGLRGLAVMSLALGLAWIGIAWRLRRGYVDAIRESIHQHRLDAAGAAPQVLDRSAHELLADKLQASDPGEILYALALYESQARGRLHPAVRSLLSHHAAEVRRRALGLLDDAGDLAVMPQVKGLLKDPDPETRTEALLFLAHHGQEDPLQEILAVRDFPDYSIQAGMIGFLCRPGPMQNVEAARFMLDNLIDPAAGATTGSRLEAAKLIGSLPVPCGTQLRSLLEDADSGVRRAAIVAAGRSRTMAAVGYLLRALGEPELAGDASTALASLGPMAVAPLAAAIDDDALPIEARRGVPAALAAIGTEEAQRALYDHLLVGDAVLRYGAIAALARLQHQRPARAVDRQAVEVVLAAEIVGHYRSYQILGTIREALAADHAIASGLEQSIRQERERIFGLLGLLARNSDIEDAYAALGGDNASLRANALELLDHVLSPDLRRLILPLVDPQVSVAERMRLANGLVGAAMTTREEAVRALMAASDPWLRSCGVWAVGALRLTSLSGELDRLAGTSDPLLRETVRAARERLTGVDVGAVPAPEERVGAETGVFDVRQGTAGLG